MLFHLCCLLHTIQWPPRHRHGLGNLISKTNLHYVRCIICSYRCTNSSSFLLEENAMGDEPSIACFLCHRCRHTHGGQQRRKGERGLAWGEATLRCLPYTPSLWPANTWLVDGGRKLHVCAGICWKRIKRQAGGGGQILFLMECCRGVVCKQKALW